MTLPIDNLTPVQRKALSIYPTYQKFFSDYRPAQLLVNFDDINTVEQSLSKIRITIGDLATIYPDTKKNFSVEYIREWLAFINRTSNINKPLTEVDPIAYMIYKDHKNLYLTDFKIVAERILRGDYGMFYGSVDAQLILKAFVNYTAERKMMGRKIRSDATQDHKSDHSEISELDLLIREKTYQIENEVKKIMKDKYSYLDFGLEFLSIKSKLMTERLDAEIPEIRENYLKQHTA